MAFRSRRAAAALAGVGIVAIVMGMLAGSVGAIPTTSFAGKADGTAFRGTINGQGLSIGVSDVTATAGPAIQSVGQGFLTVPITPIGSATRAATSYPGDPGPKTASGADAVPVPIVNSLDIVGTAQSESNIVNSEVRGFASGEVAEFGIGLNTGVLSDVISATINSPLAPITGPLLTPITGLLNQLSTALGISNVITLSVGGTTSTVVTQVTKLVADCMAT